MLQQIPKWLGRQCVIFVEPRFDFDFDVVLAISGCLPEEVYYALVGTITFDK